MAFIIVPDPEGQMQHASACDVCGERIVAHPSRHSHLYYEVDDKPTNIRIACVCVEHASKDKRGKLKKAVQSSYKPI